MFIHLFVHLFRSFFSFELEVFIEKSLASIFCQLINYHDASDVHIQLASKQYAVLIKSDNISFLIYTLLNSENSLQNKAPTNLSVLSTVH